ncbi:MAG: FAD-dependent oxidoreductase [Myxococcales bacterium]|nr:FAD-dependent oxidoreductase [Myxococcales bacterium]
MRIAIVGSGSAGLMSAWLLQSEHDVSLFEASGRIGGHINTVTVPTNLGDLPVELGAEFVFEYGYTGLHALVKRLGLHFERASLPASITIDGRPTFVLPPTTGAAIRSVLSPATLRDLLWVGRLAITGERVARAGDWGLDVAGLMARAGIPRDVAERFLIPLIASGWGVPRDVARGLAAYSVVRVMGLRLAHEPHNFTLAGGLSSYTSRLAADSPRCRLLLNSPVLGVDRDQDELVVTTDRGAQRFDAVILACDWHNSARICTGSAPLEAWRRAFESFDDYQVRVALHRDPSYMPTARALWSSGNFFLSKTLQPRNTVWSGYRWRAPVFRTWLRPGESEPPTTLQVANYRHIVVTPNHHGRQQQLARLQGTAGLWAAGMYTSGVDNHESALRSALRIAERLAPNGERVRWFSPLVSA